MDKLHESLMSELEMEATKTRRMLELVPDEKLDWRPHPKSWTLRSLAQHIANLTSWTNLTLDTSEIDFAVPFPKQDPVADNAALMSLFEEKLNLATARLAASSDREMQEQWSMRTGAVIHFTLPKGEVLRNFVLNHLVHHRGQLSVYLRLIDVRIPGMYGPSADEMNAA